ncbi:hypothetical protein L218DRAFT_930719 [Marasmius fiardii PR-910]|nr:hypothetical protein L218DRAFT_930719 [Marasmius fiardii PR-910]
MTSIDLKKASDLLIFDSKGNTVEFGSIFATQRVVVVFIRHFFCGAYVQHLASIPSEALKSANVDVVTIGCGEWNGIDFYSQKTGFPAHRIYADPTRALYRSLGMDIETLAGAPSDQERPEYLSVNGSRLKNALVSTWNGPLKNPSLLGKQGNISQLGGEFVFGPGEECSFSHLMQHTEDHVAVKELMDYAGVRY